MILAFLGLAIASPLFSAAQQEIDRAIADLKLPNQPKPYWIGLEISEGQYHYTQSKNGALFFHQTRELQQLRAEVRVGDSSFDNGNFNGTGQQGIVLRNLPTEDDELALRHEIWLALDQGYKSAVNGYAEKKAALKDININDDHLEMIPIPIQQTAYQEYQPVEDWTIPFANTLSAHFAGLDFLEESEVLIYSEIGTNHIITSEGTQISMPSSEIIIRSSASVRADDGALHKNHRSWVIKNKDTLESTDFYLTELKEMTDWLQTLQQSPIEEDYLGPVIFSEDAAVELFRQLLPSQLSASPPSMELPDYNGELPRVIPNSRIGRRLLPEGWSIVDDATLYPNQVGSYPFDDQGVTPKPVVLVENGVVTNLLMSRIPREGLSESTGHGRGLGRDRKTAFPSVVTVSPKRHSSQRRIKRKAQKMAKQAGLDYVLVIQKIEPLAETDMFEIAFSGSEQLSGLTLPTEAYRLYFDGTKEPVRGLSFVGVDRKILRDIVLAGSQSEMTGLMDDSNSRYGIGQIYGLGVSWSVPSVLIGEIELHGQGAQEKRLVPPPTASKK